MRPVEECPYRSPAGSADGDTAHCLLIEKISGITEPRHLEVARSVCTACCEDREPSEEDINSTVASLLWGIASRIGEQGGTEECPPSRCDDLKQLAARNMQKVMSPTVGPHFSSLAYSGPCFYLGNALDDHPKRYACLHEGHHEPTTVQECKDCFDYELPLERGKVRDWVVGFTTAPRDESTIEESLESLAAAGWNDPLIFAEPGSPIPDFVKPETVLFRPQIMGAWPNWLLTVMDLYLRRPHADAYLMVQDDVVYAKGLREYLEEELWPEERLGIVALHTASHLDDVAERGFYPTQPGWGAWGAQAYVIPNAGVRSLMRSPRVQNHRHRGPNDGTRNVDSVLGMWCQGVGLSYYLHTPSLTQHVGEASTLWGDEATTEGRRSASTFPGQDVEIRGVLAKMPEPVAEIDATSQSGAETRSLALVCVLIGKRDPFEEWKLWMLEASFPESTSLYLVDNSADPDFGGMLSDAVDDFSNSERFERVRFMRGPGPAKEKELSEGRCQNIADTLTTVLRRTSEDLVMIIDCDTIPPPHAPQMLSAEMTKSGSPLVSGCYESSNERGYYAAARAPKGWGNRPAMGELGPDEIIDVGYVGTGCALLDGDVLRGHLPLGARGESGALGHDSWLCEKLRADGYRIRLHGGVQCDHWI